MICLTKATLGRKHMFDWQWKDIIHHGECMTLGLKTAAHGAFVVGSRETSLETPGHIASVVGEQEEGA